MTHNHTSVFLAALGGAAEKLHPSVLSYVSGPQQPGMVGVGRGEFEVAGSRFGWLNLLVRPVVGAELLVTAHEQRVPFRVINRPVPNGARSGSLHAVRTFEFRRGPQRFVDVLEPGAAPGTLRNVLGRARRVELELSCGVTKSGHLKLGASRAWFRAGGLRVRLPKFLSVQVDVEDGYDDATGRQTIRATVRNPLIGTVLEYRGSFTYRYEVA